MARSWNGRPAGLMSSMAAAMVVMTAGGCASDDLKQRPLTDTERRRAELCDQLIGVERLGCIQETAGRPGSPYDASGQRVGSR